MLGSINKQTYIRLTKAINGLHGVAHRKQGTAIAHLPAHSKLFQQLDLARAGILELIYQQMFDLIIQLQCQFGRLTKVIAQRPRGAVRNLYKIHFTSMLKHQPQLRHGKVQQLGKCGNNLPARVFITSVWQCTYPMQCTQVINH